MPPSRPLGDDLDQIIPGGPEDRWRERALNIALAVGVSVLFGLAAAFWITTSVRSGLRHDALHAGKVNCATEAASRVSGNRFKFALREELRFIPDLVAAGTSKKLNAHQSQQQRHAGKVFFDGELAHLNADLAAERKLTPGLPKHISGFAALFPLLADSPLLTCSTRELTG